MSIYIDINGSFGSADELRIIDDSTWEVAEYDEMGEWSQSTLVAFSEEHDGMTPSEWIAQREGRKW